MLQESQDVDRTLVLYLLQHAVDDNVGACPAHAGAGRDEGTQPALSTIDRKIKKVKAPMLRSSLLP